MKSSNLVLEGAGEMSIAIGEHWCSLGSRVVPDVIRAFAGGDGGGEFKDIVEANDASRSDERKSSRSF